GPLAASNGKVEGPDDASGRTPVERSSPGVPDAAERAPRAHNLLQRPRRQAAGASRPPRTIVRSHPHNHHCARAAWASQAKKSPVLSVPMEAINEAASRLVDRCLTDATGTRPDAHRSRGGHTRTSHAPNEDACKTTRSAIVRSTQSQAKAFPILRDASFPRVTSNGEAERRAVFSAPIEGTLSRTSTLSWPR